MINENSARTAGGFFHGTLYRVGSLLPGGVRTGHVSWEMVNTGCVPKVYFQGIEDVVLIVELTHANFAERQQIMGNETPWQKMVYGEPSGQRALGVDVPEPLWFSNLLKTVTDELPKFPSES